jgi:hypothetical protein
LRDNSVPNPTGQAQSPPALATAWRAYRDHLDALCQRMLGSPVATTTADQARAINWLLQVQATAFKLVVAPRPSQPVFYTNTVFEPNIYTALLPNADFLYRYAFVTGGSRFRVKVKRGRSHFLEAQIFAGFWGDPKIRPLATYDLDKFQTNADGTIDIMVGPCAAAKHVNWLITDPNVATNTIIIREAFYDWTSEHRSELSITPVEPGPAPGSLDEAAMIERLAAASRMIDFCFKTFAGGLTDDVIKAVGFNRFQLIDTSKDEHAANPAAGYVPAVYDLAPGSALIVEVEPPPARYWNIHVGDVWWQVTDYTNRHSSLNGHQVRRDPDGKVRIVLSPVDPGVPNWLDTGDVQKGVALLRWYFAERYPEPSTRLVSRTDVLSRLPPDTPRITAEQRQVLIDQRRRAILARYGHGAA